MWSRQVTVRAPPKSVFQFLWDVHAMEDYSGWKVRALGDEVGPGFQWVERRWLRRRTWTITEFDRRGLSFTATTGDLSVTWAAKKGGRMSCNVQMKVEGSESAVRRFENSDGDRLERLAKFLNL